MTDALRRDIQQRIYRHVKETKTLLRELRQAGDDMAGISCLGPMEKNNAPPQVLANKSLAFSDEFTGTSLDPNKWRTSLLWGPNVTINNEEQYYTDVLGGDTTNPNPFSFDGDNLIITATHSPADDRYYSGVITTAGDSSGEGGFIMEPGDYVEVCAKMPCDTTGLWSAIWMLNRWYVPNPLATGPNGKFETEIDWEFVEGPGGNFGGGPYDTGCIPTAYHYNNGYCKIDANGFGCNPANGFNDGAQSQDCFGNILGTNYNPPRGFDYVCNMGDACDGFHTYGIEWELDRIVYYMDGVIVNSVCDPDIVSQIPMYLIINQAVGGNFPGPADPADYPAEMLIDYVRIYR